MTMGHSRVMKMWGGHSILEIPTGSQEKQMVKEIKQNTEITF